MHPVRCLIRPNTNIHGERIAHTPKEYPYSFDQYCVYRSIEFEKTTHTVYSDRLWEQNPDRFDACHIRVWDKLGQSFDCKNPELIEKFLQQYYRIDLDLTGVEVGCNASNGNPYWVFYFKQNESFKRCSSKLTAAERAALARREELQEESFRFFEQFE